MLRLTQIVRRTGLLVAGTALFSLASPVAAQEANGGAGLPLNLQYAGAAIGIGMVVIGAALGIGRFAAAAAESIARQPQAASQIVGAVNLPLFLLEGVAMLAWVLCLLIVLLK